MSFYRDLLGIPLEQDRDGPHWWEARFPDGVRFALHQAHAGPAPQPSGMNISFETPTLEALVERLSNAGVEVGEVVREPWGERAEVIDPDGSLPARDLDAARLGRLRYRDRQGARQIAAEKSGDEQ